MSCHLQKLGHGTNLFAKHSTRVLKGWKHDLEHLGCFGGNFLAFCDLILEKF
jgi:hypothetical protein